MTDTGNPTPHTLYSGGGYGEKMWAAASSSDDRRVPRYDDEVLVVDYKTLAETVIDLYMEAGTLNEAYEDCIANLDAERDSLKEQLWIADHFADFWKDMAKIRGDALEEAYKRGRPDL